MKMQQTECSETSAYEIQTPGITQKKAYNIQYICYMIRLLARSPKNPGSIPGTRQGLQLHSEESRPTLEPPPPSSYSIGTVGPFRGGKTIEDWSRTLGST
jgi:hypothetical protein